MSSFGGYEVIARCYGDDDRATRIIDRLVSPAHDSMSWAEDYTEWTWDVEEGLAALELMDVLARVGNLDVSLRLISNGNVRGLLAA